MIRLRADFRIQARYSLQVVVDDVRPLWQPSPRPLKIPGNRGSKPPTITGVQFFRARTSLGKMSRSAIREIVTGNGGDRDPGSKPSSSGGPGDSLRFPRSGAGGCSSEDRAEVSCGLGSTRSKVAIPVPKHSPDSDGAPPGRPYSARSAEESASLWRASGREPYLLNQTGFMN